MGWMLTASGRQVDFLNPNLAAISLDDIAKHLANTTRYTGATHWSVAAHSVYTSMVAEAHGELPYVQMWALLHDAHEAYTGDLSRPLKQLLASPLLTQIEYTLDRAIRQALGLSQFHTTVAEQIVKNYDQLMLDTEHKAFLPDHPDWQWVEVNEQLVAAMQKNKGAPHQWETWFKERFHDLHAKLGALDE